MISDPMSGSISNIPFPDELNPSKWDPSVMQPKYTTDANGNMMVSYPGLARMTREMNKPVFVLLRIICRMLAGVLIRKRWQTRL